MLIKPHHAAQLAANIRSPTDMPRSSFADLGRRERQIMDILARRGRASAAEVHEDIEDAPSYSTVRSMLRVLEDKGYVRHEWEGPRHMYVPSAQQSELKRSALEHLVQTFFGNSTEAAVVAMLGANDTKLSNEELDRLAQVIDDARGKAKAPKRPNSKPRNRSKS